MSLFPPAFVLLSFLEDSFPKQRLSFSFFKGIYFSSVDVLLIYLDKSLFPSQG